MKTQFAGVDIHIAIELLRRVEPFFESLFVKDEGDYWLMRDGNLLAQHMRKCDQLLQQLLARHPDGRGPVRLDNGRILGFVAFARDSQPKKSEG